MTVFNTFTNDARVYKEAKSLSQEGHEVLVLALDGPGLPRQESVGGFTVKRVPMLGRRLPHSSVTQLLKYLEYFGRTLHSALAWRADVYHAHNANTALIGYTASRIRHTPLIYDAHELETGRNWEGSNIPQFLRKLWIWPERLVIGGCAAVITVCDSIADELVKIYRIARPYVLRNMPERQVIPGDSMLRQRLCITPDVPLILYQGAVMGGRGLEQLIEAITLLDRGVLVVLGDGPLLQQMKRDVSRLGLAQRVHLLGKVSMAELPSYTAAANVGVALIQNVCLSYYYCLPNKLFEYLQAGVPVVASDFPEIRRVVQELEVGELVDPSRPTEIAAAIQHLIEDRSRCARLSLNAQKAAERMNWEREEERLIHVYDQVQQAMR